MKSKNKFILKLFSIIALFCLMFGSFAFKLPSKDTTTSAQSSSASSDNISTNIFIYSPIFSTIRNKKVYFVDNYDNMLKIYNLDTNKFDKNPLNLEKYDGYDFVCAESVDKYLFLMISNETTNKLIIIDLDEITSKICEIDVEYKVNQISVSKKDENKFYAALKPESNENSPILMKIDLTNAKESEPDVKSSKLKIESSTENQELKNLNETLFKILIEPQSSSDATLIFIYGKEDSKIVGFDTLSNFDEESSSEIKYGLTPKSKTINQFDGRKIEYTNANLINVNGKSHLLISYIEKIDADEGDFTEDSYLSDLFDYNYPSSSGNELESKQPEIGTFGNILTNENYIIFPNGQTISYITISNDYSTTTDSIENPEIEFENNKAEYYKTNTTTSLLTSPWNYNSPIIKLPENVDCIRIYKSTISLSIEDLDEKIEITDYIYCTLTYNVDNTDKIINGFIKTENLTKKPEEDNDLSIYGKYGEDSYPRVNVLPNQTRLYSFPSTVLNSIVDENDDGIDDSSLPSVENSYMVIPENSRVEVIDAIYQYKLSNKNNDIMLKVRVNHDNTHSGQVGYITKSSIITPSDKVDFVITNASVKGDTYVYRNNDSNSNIVDVLKDGYRVKILDRRNNPDGYTYIVYNDEDGNEYYGYIKNDSINTDSWTTLQIIGCVLIAINIGLLILILYFKNKHIGTNGETYISNKKEILKKQSD